MSHDVVTPELLDQIERQSRAEQRVWLFLEPSEEFKGCWEVDGLWPEWFIDLEPIVGNYRLVTPLKLDPFIKDAEGLGYKVVFTDPPERILDSYAVLKEDPPFSLRSSLDHTVKGFLPWQTVGFNKLIKDETIRAGYVVWDTGAGKTAFIASAIKYHREIGHPFNLALVVVKSHNKIETQRKLLRLAGVESTIIHAYKQSKRYGIYEELEERLIAGESVVAITNYEKLREDPDWFNILVRRRDCLFFWDEMPTKLSNMETQLYKRTKQVLYNSFYSRPRPTWMRHWILTATPIENSPDDVFACVNMVHPGLLGSHTQFKDIHVAARNPASGKPIAWKNLDRLEAKLAFMTHRVSKRDPEVSRMFPDPIAVPTEIDWNPKHRKIYDKLTGKAKDLLAEFEDANILSMIQIMQMVCDAPSMIKQSAENRAEFQAILEQLGDLDSYSGPKGSDIATILVDHLDPRTLTDVGHSKLDAWKEIITEKHPGEKIVTHSTWAQYIFPVWEHWLTTWDVPYVIYTGTNKQRQDALDTFRSDPDIRVFLSGDAGSDSIDIAEASVGVNYNIPWKWTTLEQRKGRRDRVNSTFDYIYTYNLVMPDSVDERKLEICERKHSYHESVFDGRAFDEAISASLSREDFLYLLFGVNDSEH